MSRQKAILKVLTFGTAVVLCSWPHGTATTPVGGRGRDGAGKAAVQHSARKGATKQATVNVNTTDVKTESLPKCGLSLQSPPSSIISFYLPYREGDYQTLSHPRLAVLDYVPSLFTSRLRIFRFDGDRAYVEFELDGPKNDPSTWEELESFPTGGQLPGVVIWGSAGGSGYGRNLATVVCYVKGKYQVVFRGYDPDFIDIVGGDIPDAVSTDEPTGDYNSDSSLVQVWTWSGERYVPAAHVPYERRFSPEVIRAIRALKKVPSS